MAIEKAGRLSLEFEPTSGLVVSVRTRPNAFSLNINEAPILEQEVVVLLPPRLERKQGCLTPLVNQNEQPILEATSFVGAGTYNVERTLRCPQMSFVQRLEVMEFDYTLRSESMGKLGLLRVRSVDEISNFGGRQNSFWLRASPYKLNVTFDQLDNATYSLKQTREGADVDLYVNWTGKARMRVSVLITSMEVDSHDGMTHGVVYPFDLEVLNRICTSPPWLGSLLEYAPRLRLARPAGPLFVLPPSSKYRSSPSIGNLPPLSLPPIGLILRTSVLTALHGEPPLEQFMDPAMEYLEQGEVSSIVALLWLSSSAEFLKDLNTYMAKRGPMRINRIESHIPADCRVIEINTASLTSEEIFAQIDEWSERIRGMYNARMLSHPDQANLLPPVLVPSLAPLHVQISLMSAARLRWQPAKIVAGETWSSDVGIWPQMPNGRGYELCAQVAKCVETDVMTHECLEQLHFESGPTQDANATYRQTWHQVHELVTSNKVRAERLILLALDGSNASEDLLKSLPALSYSSDVPAPVLSFSVHQSEQQEVDGYLADYISTAEEVFSRIWSGKGLRDDLMWHNLDRKRLLLQSALLQLIPPQYVTLIKQMRPKEIIAFTNLPLEWLELDGIALGYLSKVAKIRVESRHGTIAALLDLIRVYNSLVVRTDRPQAEPFRVLAIAPQYSGSNQQEINDSISSMMGMLQNRLQEQIEVGREISVETLHGVNFNATDVRDRLAKRRDLIFYVGHADQGELLIGDTLLDVEQIPQQRFEGAAVVLIGCTTEGWRSLSTSVANQMFALGSRAVFSVAMKLHIRIAEELSNNLFVYLLKGNWHFAEVLQMHRFSVIHTCAWIYALALMGKQQPEIYKRSGRQKTFFISEADSEYESFRDGWAAMYRHFEKKFSTDDKSFLMVGPDMLRLPVSGSDILRRMAPFGLTLTFNGRLRDRLFTF